MPQPHSIRQPQFRVTFGRSFRDYFTAYHAEQFARALAMNSTPHKLERRT